MLSRRKNISIWYIYIFVILIFIAILIFISYVKFFNYENQYQSPLQNKNGNLKVAVINRNDNIKICDIQINIDSTKLVHGNFFHDENGHNYSFYKFKIEQGNYLISINSDSLNTTFVDSINVSDFLLMIVTTTDNITVQYENEEVIFL